MVRPRARSTCNTHQNVGHILRINVRILAQAHEVRSVRNSPQFSDQKDKNEPHRALLYVAVTSTIDSYPARKNCISLVLKPHCLKRVIGFTTILANNSPFWDIALGEYSIPRSFPKLRRATNFNAHNMSQANTKQAESKSTQRKVRIVSVGDTVSKVLFSRSV